MIDNDGIKRLLGDYFLVQAESAFAIAVIGTLFAPQITITFKYFFLPAILGIMYMAPCLILYFKEDLPVWAIIIQRIVEWVVIEAGTLWAASLIFRDYKNIKFYIAIFVIVLIFQIATYVVGDYTDNREILSLNEKLKELQSKE